jgi:hypothetical protein
MISLNRLKNDNKSEISQNVSININNNNNNNNDTQEDVKVQYSDANPYASIKDDAKDDAKIDANDNVSNLILQFILNDLEVNNGIILLSIDELKKVLKVLCHCDDVIIEVVPPNEKDVSCCSYISDDALMYVLEVKKILLKYNDKECLENFKMHYNEIKILKESYKVDIGHVKC